MRLRKNFFPKSASDTSCFILCFTFIPITLIFELAIVLPEIHPNGIFYWLTAVAGLFLAFNVFTNYLACVLTDTSIKITILSPPLECSLRRLWRFCFECDCLVPPRSWHCQICKICVLKREHHCMFTGCCIGHHNNRYFFLFVAYMAVGSACTTVYSSMYLWIIHSDIYANGLSLVKMFLPLMMLTLDLSWENVHLLIYELNVIAFIYSTTLIIYHMPNILIGAVSHEKKSLKYDKGRYGNIEMIFGNRMYLTWISPFVKSDLPHDGVQWDTVISQISKNR